MGRLDEKTAIITGASRGIGAVMAIHIAKEGAKVLVADVLDTSKTVETIKTNGGKATGLKVDVTSDTDLSKMVELAEKDLGGLDILINNAAKDPTPNTMTDETKFETMSMDYWSDGLNVALNGTFICTQVISRKMVENGGGVILNISSDLGVIAPDQRISRAKA